LSPSAVALGLGTAIQTGLVVAGLSAATVHAPAAFAPLKYIGASYLVFMGLQRLLAKNADQVGSGKVKSSSRWIVVDGILESLSNPISAMFLMAFLPQFVPESAPAAGMIVLGVLFVLLGVLFGVGYALLGARIGSWVRGGRTIERGRRYVVAITYIAIGIAAAVAQPV
jgi:threonine/homoserine/homoserine lactone efflux protein